MHPMTNRILVNLLQTCCRPTTWPWTSPSQNTCHESRAPAEAQNAMLLPLEEQPKHPRLAGKRMCRCVTAPKPYVLRRKQGQISHRTIALAICPVTRWPRCMPELISPTGRIDHFSIVDKKNLPDIFHCAGVQHCALHAKQAQSLRWLLQGALQAVPCKR